TLHHGLKVGHIRLKLVVIEVVEVFLVDPEEVLQVEVEWKLQDAEHVLLGAATLTPSLPASERASGEVAVDAYFLVCHILERSLLHPGMGQRGNAHRFIHAERVSHCLECFTNHRHRTYSITTALIAAPERAGAGMNALGGLLVG